MCGIAGIYNARGISPDTSLIRAMSASLEHRGPDEEGFHTDSFTHLASRRLSIIDLATGSQPIYSRESSLCIVFNGEIYNFNAVRSELISLGHTFQTRSDTEVILNAYLEWGGRCLDRLSGMFAFCIWNPRNRELFIARDRFGIKPLYYTILPDGTFLFASEVKSILKHPGVKKRAHLSAVDNLLTFGFNVAPYTFFEDIKQILPGCFVKVRPSGATFTQYWDVELEAPLIEASVDEIACQFRERLQKAVRAGIIADVPVATYLSGGIDSSSITGMYATLSDEAMKSLTITFEEAGYDERQYSRLVSSHFGTEYIEFPCSIEPHEIKSLIYHLENPIVSLLNLPFFLLARKARELGIKVVLTGDGADEIFGGYDYFKVLKAMDFIGVRESECRQSVLRKIYPQLTSSQALDSIFLRLKIAGQRFPAVCPAVPYRYQGFPQKSQLYSDEFKEALKESRPIEPIYFDTGRIAHRSLIDQALYIEIKMRLLNLTLPLADKMSMANSVEARPLFLDHELVNFLFRVPSHYKMLGLSEKFLLKKSMSGFLPEEICRRKKQPFQPPAGWFLRAAGELLSECLAPETVKKVGFFDPDYVSRLMRNHEQNQQTGLSDLLVAIFFVQLWHYTFFESASDQSWKVCC